jgi:hypothetical protein
MFSHYSETHVKMISNSPHPGIFRVGKGVATALPISPSQRVNFDKTMIMDCTFFIECLENNL